MSILAIDQGTTGTTAALYDESGQLTRKAYREFTQIYPQPGWVEHDPEEIWKTVMETVNELLAQTREKISAVGITNQRETTVLWDKASGKPVYNAVVWQCRRTQAHCEKLKPHSELFRSKTGLPLDAYFSGTKIKWILDHIESRGQSDLLFGTIDSWLIWKLTDGKSHLTDHTNASRTLLYNIHEKKWDEELCQLLEVPRSLLPEVKNSVDHFGEVRTVEALAGVPISGVAGDQQAALFGQTCFSKGELKNTYGTGCFMMMNTGSESVDSRKGLLTTLAVEDSGNPCFALEGSVFIAGAAIQWLRDELKILDKASDSETAALSIKGNGGVYLVPAFVGLGAPYWDMGARGILSGLTRGTGRNHIIRAALESIAYPTLDVIKAMEEELQISVPALAVDGGAAANNFLLQFQSDILNKKILRLRNIESTSQGAAYLAGLQNGYWNISDLKSMRQIEREFSPNMPEEVRRKNYRGWKSAVDKTLSH